MVETRKGSSEDQETQITEYILNLDILNQNWLQERGNLVRILRKIAKDIQKHENNSRIAKITGASTSIVGTGVQSLHLSHLAPL